MNKIKLISRDAEDTEVIGMRIGNIIKQMKLPVIVLLYGELGTGKTTLIKGIASAMGIEGRDVASASFVIASEYDSSPPFCHLDLYRLSGEHEVEDIGLWDYLNRDCISVIEWADRINEPIEEAISIKIKDLDENIREITIEGLNEKDWDNQ